MPIKEHAKDPKSWGILGIIIYLITNGYLSSPKAASTVVPEPSQQYVTMPQVDKRFDERMEVWDERFKQMKESLDRIEKKVDIKNDNDRRHSLSTPKKTSDVFGVIPDSKAPIIVEVVD